MEEPDNLPFRKCIEVPAKHPYCLCEFLALSMLEQAKKLTKIHAYSICYREELFGGVSSINGIFWSAPRREESYQRNRDAPVIFSQEVQDFPTSDEAENNNDSCNSYRDRRPHDHTHCSRVRIEPARHLEG